MALIAKIAATVHDGQGGTVAIQAGASLKGQPDAVVQQLQALGATAEAPDAATTTTRQSAKASAAAATTTTAAATSTADTATASAADSAAS
ncbi:MAG: hypothetical protein QM617_04860 [Comamonas sp.]